MSEKSPSEQLRNICAALEEDLNESPFTREEWDRLDAERLELLKANDSLAARLAEAEALLREAHDKHWPFMGDLADRIGAFLAGSAPAAQENERE